MIDGSCGPAPCRLFIRQRLTSVLGKERGSDLERLTELIEAGKVTPSIDRTYPLDQVAGGHAPPRRRTGPGKDRHHHLSHPAR